MREVLFRRALPAALTLRLVETIETRSGLIRLCGRPITSCPDEGQEATLNRPPTPGTRFLSTLMSAFPRQAREDVYTNAEKESSPSRCAYSAAWLPCSKRPGSSFSAPIQRGERVFVQAPGSWLALTRQSSIRYCCSGGGPLETGCRVHVHTPTTTALSARASR
jgi:hypothetical protein